jgi:hypothetical protein
LRVLFFIFTLAGIVVLLKMARSYHQERPRTWGERFVHVFKRYGYRKRPGETLQEFSTEIALKNSLLGQKALAFVEDYYSIEYGHKGETKSLESLLKELKKKLKSSH